ncbi:PhoX family phosphatase [Nocardiopsis sp. CT-R113]|uniref:PhoX family phosphatase n=1 Tax=Nocardiopsis codii TaxID=3065942 RepID=A0ABU7KCD6_9ACTN|nr:PhoX family phosphatase [Nocardiopsis sp. CT-R113]MEE2039894.1 PhoX family phosphatase [Nocardiopsis sp. CT-R113]
MPESAPRRRPLPLLGQAGGGRSRATCALRCGDACFHPAPNTSDNPYFGDIFQKALSRRTALRAGAVGAGASALGLSAIGTAAADRGPGRPHPAPRPTFTSVQPNTDDKVTIPRGYDQHVIIRWGDPVLPGAPEFDLDAQTAQAQEQQFGYNCDYVGFQLLDDDNGLLWVNHEYTNEELMFPGYTDGASADEEHIRIAMAAHGGSIVELKRHNGTGEWRLSDGERAFNRRLTATTPMRLTGPAAGHELLRTQDDPDGTLVKGMLNNCAGGMTPWGTFLTAEENFNQYFGNAPAGAEYARYGMGAGNASRRWDRVDERFDLARHPNEANRFGYIVEVDPLDPASEPLKRTMLGRIKHEGATIRLTDDGRVAAYMGDDERFDYMYKFVSAKKYVEGSRRHNLTLLDTGTLYVARLTGNSPSEEFDGSGALPEDGEFDGSGEWIALCTDTESFVDGFSVAEVLIRTRLAADTVGATKMDRPEDFEPSPVTGKVYCALTNNSAREPGQADEPNPRGPNKHGHILEIVESGSDAGATEFAWNVPIVCGDPEDDDTYYAGFDKSKVMPISAPDNLTFDKDGNLWISTDGQPGALGINDALHVVPVEGRFRGELRTFATVPVGAEACGPLITEDNKTVFLAPQHPGDGGTLAEPTSTWPDGDFPRPSVLCVWHTSGRDVGK